MVVENRGHQLQLKNIGEEGLTLPEMLLVVVITLLFLGMILVYINPAEYFAKGRDEKRLSDVQTLDRAINEYLLDVGDFPDKPEMLRKSNQLPIGSEGPLENPKDGWITSDLSLYFVKIPLDPINDDNTYFYSYKRTENGYELNANLEYYSDTEEKDGGNDSGIYEVGNDLTIM